MVDRRRFYVAGLALVLVATAFGLDASAKGPTADVQRISVSSDEVPANQHSYAPAVSQDGRYVAFRSWANTLVVHDTNASADVFVRDTFNGETTRVSVSSEGAQQNNFSDFAPAMTPDGRYVAFQSFATNLVPGDTNGHGDIFVHDRLTGETDLVSVASDGTQANGSSFGLAISPDGRYVAFESVADNLVPDDTNACAFNVCPDIFVRDRETGETTRVSLAFDGSEANGSSYTPAFAAGGRFVVFQSYATNLVSGDTNARSDIFRYDRNRSEIERISLGESGVQGNGETYGFSITASGRFLAFGSASTNLVDDDENGHADVFLRDLRDGTTTLISVRPDGVQGNDFSVGPSISAGARFIAFVSKATNFVPHDTNLCRVDDDHTFEPCPDVFLLDGRTGRIKRVSISATGEQGDRESDLPALSADGRAVAFESRAGNLVPNDGNRKWDIFLYRRAP